MTKKFDVIPVEDYGVVVDKESPIRAGDKYWKGGFKIGHAHQDHRPYPHTEGTLSYPKIIATIGKEIEGLPLIELPEEIGKNGYNNGYTGVKDRKGVKIYEGDEICVYEDNNPFHKENIGIVTWGKGNYYCKGTWCQYNIYAWRNSIEVIKSNKTAQSKGVYSEDDMLGFGKFMQTAKSNAYTTLRTAMENTT